MRSIASYENLIVWQRAMDLVIEAYVVVNQYPKEELYGLTSQTKRSAISIPSNIAEGHRRKNTKEFRYFLIIAYGSGAELETQLKIAQRLSFGKNIDFSRAENLLTETMKMLNKFINSTLAS